MAQNLIASVIHHKNGKLLNFYPENLPITAKNWIIKLFVVELKDHASVFICFFYFAK